MSTIQNTKFLALMLYSFIYKMSQYQKLKQVTCKDYELSHVKQWNVMSNKKKREKKNSFILIEIITSFITMYVSLWLLRPRNGN